MVCAKNMTGCSLRYTSHKLCFDTQGNDIRLQFKDILSIGIFGGISKLEHDIESAFDLSLSCLHVFTIGGLEEDKKRKRLTRINLVPMCSHKRKQNSPLFVPLGQFSTFVRVRVYAPLHRGGGAVSNLRQF